MSEHDLEHGPDLPEAPKPRFSGSMVDQLRQKHAELLKEKSINIPIPGYSGELVAKYRILDVTEEMNSLTARVMNEFRSPGEQNLYGTIDALIMACEGIFYNNRADGKLVPLSESIGPDEPPIKYDNRLEQFLDIKAESARDCVLKVFGNNEPAILEHGRQLNVWMTGSSQGVMDEFQRGL